jgi:hypothetical protein
VLFTPPRITKRPERIREEGEDERCLNTHIMAGFTFVQTGRKVFKNKMLLTTSVTGKGKKKLNSKKVYSFKALACRCSEQNANPPLK